MSELGFAVGAAMALVPAQAGQRVLFKEDLQAAALRCKAAEEALDKAHLPLCKACQLFPA